MPLPDGLPGFVRWSATILTMPRFRECGYTFKECTLLAFKDSDAGTQMAQYLKWILNRYGGPENVETVKDKNGCLRYKVPICNQARDLACYLRACNWLEELNAYKGPSTTGGYKRQFKGMSVNP